MNKKIKRKWCAALRGGKWIQIKGQYHDDKNGRCAMGVLLNEVLVAPIDPPMGWLDLWMKENIPWYHRDEIAKMNDTGMSFLEIADWIEKNLNFSSVTRRILREQK